jgi:general secretion pathway protein D
MLRTAALFVCLLLVISCAPREAVKPEAALPKPPEEELKLPEPPARPEEQKAERRTEPVRIEKAEEEQFIVLNFDNAELDTVIATFGELLNVNYLLSPGITGKVTIQSYKKFPAKDLFRLFQSILEINGLTAVQDGPLYRIVPIDMAKQQPLPVEKGKEPAMVLDSSFITQLVPLEFVKASDVANILRSLAPRGTDIVIYEPANLLIVTATPATLVKFMKLIETIDIVETERESIRTFVYYVENGEAKKLEGILKSIYGEKKEGAVARPAATPAVRRTPATPVTPVAVGESVPGEIGELSVTAYEDINALIVKSTPRTYLSFLELMKRLDVPAKQVLIDLLVAEVTLRDRFQFGLEWLIRYIDTEGDITGITGGFNTGSISIDEETGDLIPALTVGGLSGIITGVFDSTKVAAAINTLSSAGRLNVLASPHVLAMDNKEAKIEIGSEVPIATGQIIQQPATASTTSNQFNTASQIQYKTVGTLLTVTPHITERHKVTLKIAQEVSQPGGTVLVAGQEFQGFDTRKTNTTAVVDSGHTLLIGGLIRESKNFARTGIPLLSKIPILGYLFSTTTENFEKTELIVLVTPHVVSGQEEADILTSEFKDRVRLVREDLEEMARKLEKETEKEEKK